MEPIAATEEKGGIEEGPAEQTQPEEVAGGSGFKFDVNVPSRGDITTPDGATYKEQPPENPGGGETPGGGGGENPPPPPPPPPEEGGGQGIVPPTRHTVRVTSANPSSGVLIDATPDVSGNAGGLTQFQRVYTNGTSVTLTAPLISPSGTIFQGWRSTGGLYDSANPTVNFTVDRSITMRAVYVNPIRLTVTSAWPSAGVPVQVSVPDIVTGLTDGNTPFFRDYYSNTTVTLIAPSTFAGVGFLRWLKDGVTYSLSPTTTVTMVANTTMTAVYQIHNLRVRSSAPGVGVSITVSPNDVNGSGGANTPYDRLYFDGAVVTLVAAQVAPNDNVFKQWLQNGVFYSTNRTIVVTMNMDYTMMAAYVYVPGIIPNPPVSPSGL